MRRANTRGEAVARLEVLTQDNSELIMLLKAVDKNTSSRVTDILRDVSGGRVGASASSHPVAEAFHSFHEFVAPSAKNAGIEKYRQELEDMRNALMVPGEVQAVSNQLKARSEVDILIQYLDTRTQKTIGKLLREPFLFVLAPKCPRFIPIQSEGKARHHD